ncbi:MAG TPA: zf-HC2 domain-containing protein [Vicinamibacterales bacterium]|nr:zf-HC2 domain-containing protein [Vicinamibacterales bacterium]
MKCADLQSDVLVDLVDGRLEPAVQREVERHLEACPECRALVTDLRSIRASAFMLDRREPPMATWNKLQDAIASEPAPKGKLLAMPGVVRRSLGDGGWPVWLGAAAALILAMVIGLLPLMNRNAAAPPSAVNEPAQPEVTVESVAAEFEAAEQHYQKAIDDLQTIANKDTGELDPQVAAVLQKNLSVIDQAISESRAALKTQPTNTNAQDGLFDALRTKVALLQQTVELINEMRKGNQAEAGRRFQTLSQ